MYIIHIMLMDAGMCVLTRSFGTCTTVTLLLEMLCWWLYVSKLYHEIHICAVARVRLRRSKTCVKSDITEMCICGGGSDDDIDKLMCDGN